MSAAFLRSIPANIHKFSNAARIRRHPEFHNRNLFEPKYRRPDRYNQARYFRMSAAYSDCSKNFEKRRQARKIEKYCTSG